MDNAALLHLLRNGQQFYHPVQHKVLRYWLLDGKQSKCNVHNTERTLLIQKILFIIIELEYNKLQTGLENVTMK